MRRCKKQKSRSWGDILSPNYYNYYIMVSMRSSWLQVSKSACHWPLKTICSLRNCEQLSRLDCQFWFLNPQLLWNRLFGGNLGEMGIVEFNGSNDGWVNVLLAHGDIGNCWICKFKSLFLSQFLLSLGLEVDNPGQFCSLCFVFTSLQDVLSCL
jgi:hypothetical protein